jgi:hypothetical protein
MFGKSHTPADHILSFDGETTIDADCICLNTSSGGPLKNKAYSESCEFPLVPPYHESLCSLGFKALDVSTSGDGTFDIIYRCPLAECRDVELAVGNAISIIAGDDCATEEARALSEQIADSTHTSAYPVTSLGFGFDPASGKLSGILKLYFSTWKCDNPLDPVGSYDREFGSRVVEALTRSCSEFNAEAVMIHGVSRALNDPPKSTLYMVGMNLDLERNARELKLYYQIKNRLELDEVIDISKRAESFFSANLEHKIRCLYDENWYLKSIAVGAGGEMPRLKHYFYRRR